MTHIHVKVMTLASALTYHTADDVDIVDLSLDESNYTIITQPSHSDFCGPAQSIQLLYGDAGVGIDGSNPVGKAALPHKAEVEEVLDHDVARSKFSAVLRSWGGNGKTSGMASLSTTGPVHTAFCQ